MKKIVTIVDYSVFALFAIAFGIMALMGITNQETNTTFMYVMFLLAALGVLAALQLLLNDVHKGFLHGLFAVLGYGGAGFLSLLGLFIVLSCFNNGVTELQLVTKIFTFDNNGLLPVVPFLALLVTLVLFIVLRGFVKDHEVIKPFFIPAIFISAFLFIQLTDIFLDSRFLFLFFLSTDVSIPLAVAIFALFEDERKKTAIVLIIVALLFLLPNIFFLIEYAEFLLSYPNQILGRFYLALVTSPFLIFLTSFTFLFIWERMPGLKRETEAQKQFANIFNTVVIIGVGIGLFFLQILVFSYWWVGLIAVFAAPALCLLGNLLVFFVTEAIPAIGRGLGVTLLFIFLLALGPIGWIILLVMTIASGSSGSGGYSGGGSGGSAKYVNVTEDIVSDWLHENSVLGGAMMNGFVEVSSSGKNVYVTCSDSTYRSLAETAVEKGERKKGIRAANIVFTG